MADTAYLLCASARSVMMGWCLWLFLCFITLQPGVDLWATVLMMMLIVTLWLQIFVWRAQVYLDLVWVIHCVVLPSSSTETLARTVPNITARVEHILLQGKQCGVFSVTADWLWCTLEKPEVVKALVDFAQMWKHTDLSCATPAVCFWLFHECQVTLFQLGPQRGHILLTEETVLVFSFLCLSVKSSLGGVKYIHNNI